MTEQRFHVYIMTNHLHSVLYIGVTNNLERRVIEHKTNANDGFTKRYGVHHLVYAEQFAYADQAIAREKELKGWRRSRKDTLIVTENPEWFDLAADWFASSPAT